jgi:polyisoprenoid-binding protein YceI
MTATEAPTGTLPLAPGHWTVDAAHSSVTFQVRHLGLTNVRGRFDRFDAGLDVGSTLDEVSVSASVDLASVNTNQPDRDAHLRSTDFFSVETNPAMTFTSTSVSGAGEDYELSGDLTINGVTRPVTFDVELHGTQEFPADGSLRAGFELTGQIKRSDFGIDFGLALGADKVALGDKVKIAIDLELIAPQS